MPGIDENAYALLTNIQGFDSFSLGPHSSIDEIQRAFHTQSLIWHPDKNPGDTQAVRIYKRMKRSYDILMDPTLRKAHDERMTANACTATAADVSRHPGMGAPAARCASRRPRI
jgi:DnaJ-class molecular chaperone